MCSSGDSTLKSSEEAQAAFTQSLQSHFETAFANNQGILAKLRGLFNDIIKNPQGFSPTALTGMRTSASDTVATQTNNTIKSVQNAEAARGGSDLPSGVEQQIGAGVRLAGGQQLATEQNNITLANEELRQQNYWKGIAGLAGVAEGQNPSAYMTGANSGANATANLGSAFLQSQNADWQHAAGIISGVGGLATAASGFMPPA